MVELATAPYDSDGIPLVPASVVAIDAELDTDYMVAAEVVPLSPISSISSSVDPSRFSTRDTSLSSQSEYSTGSSHLWQQESDTMESAPGTSPPTMEAETERQRVYGAGAAGAVIGLFMGGPIVSVILGLGGIYYSSQHGATGDLARALGDVALVAREKFIEVDSKHHIVDKSKAAAKDAIHQMKETDRKHRVKKKFFRFVGYCWKNTLDFIERHKLVERGAAKVKGLADHWAENRRLQDENAGSTRWSNNNSLWGCHRRSHPTPATCH